ncbi:MAG: single-stranded-DNA-specific exonuclease RecJ, partial [Gammaproteobacteria bacterium]|jgi:single-stranded-DNA-specific exonuclease|nr:single-stranded-DNA-specific exonuclease RecJ [Gammaproteobacteria bacterium]
LTIKKAHFAEFKQVFEQLIAQMDAELFHAVLWTDGELPPEAFHLHTVEMLQHLAPWGHKFPQPVFEGRFKVVDFRWLKETHLKLRLVLQNGQVLDAIAFGAKDKFDFNPMLDHVRLVYELERNVFNSNVSLQLQIVHLEQ